MIAICIYIYFSEETTEETESKHCSNTLTNSVCNIYCVFNNRVIQVQIHIQTHKITITNRQWSQKIHCILSTYKQIAGR